MESIDSDENDPAAVLALAVYLHRNKSPDAGLRAATAVEVIAIG
jgi:hypothetical protein